MTHMLRIPGPLAKVAILVDAYASLREKRIPESSPRKSPSSATGNFAVDKFAPDKTANEKCSIGKIDTWKSAAKEASAQIITRASTIKKLLHINYTGHHQFL